MKQIAWSVLVVVGLAVSACEYAVPSRAISADVDATFWNGPVSLYPGRTLDLRDEPQGAVPWHP